MEWLIWVWVGIVVVSAVIEALSLDMTSIWVTCGGLVSLVICAIFPNAILWQVIPFVVVTTLCIIFLRPITKKLISKKTVETNISSFVGKKAVLLSAITEFKLGTLKVNDVIWNAKASDDLEIEQGEEVEIVEVQGNKLIVKKVSTNKEKKEKANKTEKIENAE